MLTIVPFLFKAFETKKQIINKTPEKKSKQKMLISFNPIKFSLNTVLKQICKKKISEIITFEELKEFFKKVELLNRTEIEREMNIIQIELLFENYTDLKILKEKDIIIPMNEYTKMTEEQIKEYSLEDQYFWLFNKNKEFRNILEKKIIYEKKLIETKKEIDNMKETLIMPIFLEEEKEFIKEIIRNVLHLINLL
ncbi:hypothetical protein Mgra_00006961, partial [Meloidogyne graminicola]